MRVRGPPEPAGRWKRGASADPGDAAGADAGLDLHGSALFRGVSGSASADPGEAAGLDAALDLHGNAPSRVVGCGSGPRARGSSAPPGSGSEALQTPQLKPPAFTLVLTCMGVLLGLEGWGPRPPGGRGRCAGRVGPGRAQSPITTPPALTLVLTCMGVLLVGRDGSRPPARPGAGQVEPGPGLSRSEWRRRP